MREFARNPGTGAQERMSPTLIVIGSTVLAAFVVSVAQFAKKQAVSSCLRLIGTVLLLVVVIAHLAEKFQWLEWMSSGLPDSPGHYIDLVSAILGVSLFSGGLLLPRLAAHGMSDREPPKRLTGASLPRNGRGRRVTPRRSSGSCAANFVIKCRASLTGRAASRV
jgi:hypothetical protein